MKRMTPETRAELERLIVAGIATATIVRMLGIDRSVVAKYETFFRRPAHVPIGRWPEEHEDTKAVTGEE